METAVADEGATIPDTKSNLCVVVNSKEQWLEDTSMHIFKSLHLYEMTTLNVDAASRMLRFGFWTTLFDSMPHLQHLTLTGSTFVSASGASECTSSTLECVCDGHWE